MNTAEAASPGAYNGSLSAGSRVTVRGRGAPAEPAYITISPLPPAEVVVFVKS